MKDYYELASRLLLSKLDQDTDPLIQRLVGAGFIVGSVEFLPTLFPEHDLSSVVNAVRTETTRGAISIQLAKIFSDDDALRWRATDDPQMGYLVMARYHLIVEALAEAVFDLRSPQQRGRPPKARASERRAIIRKVISTPKELKDEKQLLRVLRELDYADLPPWTKKTGNPMGVRRWTDYLKPEFREYREDLIDRLRQNFYKKA